LELGTVAASQASVAVEVDNMKLRTLTVLALSQLMWLAACGEAEKSEQDFFQGRPSVVNGLVQANQDQWLIPQIPQEARGKYDRVIGFGDSLSDTGNLNRNTLGVFVNKRVYWEGRWSNGPVWMEYLSKALNARLENYAVGAAETREKASIGPDRLVIPGLGRQIDQFLRDNGKAKLDRSLVAVWIGANNYLFEGNSDPTQAVADIRAGLERLVQSGAKDLLVGRVGDLSNVDNTSKTREQLKALGPEHNRQLDLVLVELRAKYPNVTFRSFRSDEETKAQVNELDFYEFRDTTNRCYNGDLFGNFTGEEKLCDDYQGIRLWDNVHPNTKAHCYYAVQALEDLSLPIDRLALIERCRELDPKRPR
jgi:phospholipase/lecithinase/hemolysin